MNTSNFTRMTLAVLAGMSTLALASVADAQQAYVSARTTLRAGPDHGYPQVAWLGGGTTVYVNGCVRGYYWCDVTSGGVRGWANARHLQYYHHNRRVALYGNGASYGFPVVGFALGSYWDNHYRNQGWYGNRSHWNNWRPGTPAPRFDAYPSRPHYDRPHVAAPAPRPYVREVAPPQYQQQYQNQYPPQGRPHQAPVQQQFRAPPPQQPRAQPQAQPQPQGRVRGQENPGNLQINGSLR
jgi:uncharacterized protein YraI